MKKVNKAFCKSTMLIKEQATMDFFLTLPPFFFIFLTAAYFSNIGTILMQGDWVSDFVSNYQSKKKNLCLYLSKICLFFTKENSNISLSYGGIKLLWLRDSPFLQRVNWGQIEWILKSWRNVVIRFCCNSSTETKKGIKY